MEEQTNGSTLVDHLDVAYLLVGIVALVDNTAIVTCGEVGKRCGGRQVGSYTDHIVRSGVVLQAQFAGDEFRNCIG